MCCGGKCLFFIPLRTASLIFGYIIAVISAMGTITCTGIDMFYGIHLMFPYYSTQPKYYDIAIVTIVTGYLAEFLSSFICSVLLLVGITQNKPGLIKTFLIYGMVQVVLLMVFFIMVHCVTSFFNAGFLLLATAFVVVYVMCLYMVFKTYQPMTGGHVFVNPPTDAVIQHLTSRIRSERRGEVLSPSGI